MAEIEDNETIRRRRTRQSTISEDTLRELTERVQAAVLMGIARSYQPGGFWCELTKEKDDGES